MSGFPVRSGLSFSSDIGVISKSPLGFWGTSPMGPQFGGEVDCDCISYFQTPDFDYCEYHWDMSVGDGVPCSPLAFVYTSIDLSRKMVPIRCIGELQTPIGPPYWVVINDATVPDVAGSLILPPFPVDGCPESEVYYGIVTIYVYGYCKTDRRWTWCIVVDVSATGGALCGHGIPFGYMPCGTVNNCHTGLLEDPTTHAGGLPALYMGKWTQQTQVFFSDCSAGCVAVSGGTYDYDGTDVLDVCGEGCTDPPVPTDPDGPLFRDNNVSQMICYFTITISGITAFEGLNGTWTMKNCIGVKDDTYWFPHILPAYFSDTYPGSVYGTTPLAVFISDPGGMKTTDAVAHNLMAPPQPDVPQVDGDDYQCRFGPNPNPATGSDWTLAIGRTYTGTNWGDWVDYLYAYKRSDVLGPDPPVVVVIAAAPSLSPTSDWFAYYPYGGPWQVSKTGEHGETIIQDDDYSVSGVVIVT